MAPRCRSSTSAQPAGRPAEKKASDRYRPVLQDRARGRGQLVRDWADFLAPDRTLCTQTAAIRNAKLRRADHLPRDEARRRKAAGRPRPQVTALEPAGKAIGVRRDRAARHSPAIST